MDASEAARLLAQQPRPRRHPKVCEACGKPFLAARSDARCCSLACAHAAYVARRREQRRREKLQREADAEQRASDSF